MNLHMYVWMCRHANTMYVCMCASLSKVFGPANVIVVVVVIITIVMQRRGKGLNQTFRINVKSCLVKRINNHLLLNLPT